MKAIARWVLLIGLVGLGLMYLNSAFYSAWVASGPPNDFPKIWEQRYIKHMGYFIALISSGIMAYVALGKKYNLKKSKLKFIWAIILLLSLTYPKCREYIQIDKCLDSGGAWDSKYFECKK